MWHKNASDFLNSWPSLQEKPGHEKTRRRARRVLLNLGSSFRQTEGSAVS